MSALQPGLDHRANQLRVVPSGCGEQHDGVVALRMLRGNLPRAERILRHVARSAKQPAHAPSTCVRFTGSETSRTCVTTTSARCYSVSGRCGLCPISN